MSRLPIRIRLTLVFAVVMAVVLAALGVFLYVRLGDSLDERIAEDLDARRIALTRVVSSGVSDVDPSLLAGEEGLARVIGPEASRPVLAAPSSSAVLLTADEVAAARTGVVTRQRAGYRLLATPVGDDVVLVGEPLDDRKDALSALRSQLLVALPLALLISSLIGYVVAGAALRPMEVMRRRAGEISASTSAQRLPLPVAHDEVYRLGDTLNEMLERLDAGLERERRFVADASHELRTPLAILKTELEVALRQPRATAELELAIRSAAEETDRLVRLAEDLLLVARSDRGAFSIELDPVPVDELMAEVAGRFRGRADVDARSLEVEPDARDRRRPRATGTGARQPGRQRAPPRPRNGAPTCNGARRGRGTSLHRRGRLRLGVPPPCIRTIHEGRRRARRERDRSRPSDRRCDRPCARRLGACGEPRRRWRGRVDHSAQEVE